MRVVDAAAARGAAKRATIDADSQIGYAIVDRMKNRFPIFLRAEKARIAGV